MLTVPRILSIYFSSPFLMTPSAPIKTGIISVPIFHSQVISSSKSLHFETEIIIIIIIILIIIIIKIIINHKHIYKYIYN